MIGCEEDVREAFARVREEGNYGAVVLTGSEEEFHAGGMSEEEMEELQGLIVGVGDTGGGGGERECARVELDSEPVL